HGRSLDPQGPLPIDERDGKSGDTLLGHQLRIRARYLAITVAAGLAAATRGVELSGPIELASAKASATATARATRPRTAWQNDTGSGCACTVSTLIDLTGISRPRAHTPIEPRADHKPSVREPLTPSPGSFRHASG